MIDQTLHIGDLVEIPPVQTVIRLEEGRTRSESIAQSFVFTEEVAAHFSVLADALVKDHGRGFFLQGDFGSGKSHFLAALSTWLSDRPGAEVLSAHHSALGRAGAAGRNILPVDVSLLNYRATTPLERILIEAIETALISRGTQTRLTPLTAFLDHFKTLLKTGELAEAFSLQLNISADEIDALFSADPRRCYVEGVRFMKEQGLKTPEVLVEERHETFERAINTVIQAGFDGLMLIVDELSEFFRSKPDARGLNEDARTLQLLGEVAGGQPIWIIAAVQESIEKTGDIAQVTFQKIKDRFPVKFALSTVHIKALISQRLVQRKSGAEKELYGIFEYLRHQFPSIAWSFEDFQATYPVHPATIALLDGLGDLFSQHRGIVDFVHSRLAGDEDRQITGILDHPSFQLLGPDSIYEHFSQRLAEFSTFFVYPKHIIPHMDGVIAKIIEDPGDRALARRIVRVLVLYNIHPTVTPPTARELTALVSCALSDRDPDLNVQFVTEAILDPLVRESMFLVKHPGDSGDVLDDVYEILTQQDPTKTLQAKIARRAEDIAPDDTRLLLEPFSELPESPSWPGPGILQGGIFRLVTWRQSSRRGLVALLTAGGEAFLADRIKSALSSGEGDFAVVISLAKNAFECKHTAVWEISLPRETKEISALRQFLAVRQICAELRTTNPADAPLIQPAREVVDHLRPLAHQAAVHILYAGNFTEPAIIIEPVIRQMKRFDRLIEDAAHYVLENRYPGYREIAPRKVTPSRLLYQRLLDEFVAPGKLSLKEAHAKGLSDAIDGLATPLGMVELRAGSYILAPDPEHHPLLSELFGMLKAAGQTPLPDVLQALAIGRYGLPTDSALFLFCALAHGGLISLLKNNRPLPLELLRLNRVETADTLAPGDVIGKHDRETLINECAYLAPAGDWESFGLRQQREAWQAAIKFRDWARNAIADIEKRLGQVAAFSAFEAFDIDGLRFRLEALKTLSAEIKISYPAREGLERFLKTWRETGCTSQDIEFIKKMQQFFKQEAEQFIFFNHYARHNAIEATASGDQNIGAQHGRVIRLLEQPENLIKAHDFAGLAEVFEQFRTLYAEAYSVQHASYYQLFGKKPLTRFAKRALVHLKRLAAIEALDRPAGMTEFLREIEAPPGPVCKRNPAEELARSPVCGCGFVPGEAVKPTPETAPQDAIENYLDKYMTILRQSEVKEAISARTFALGDAEPDAAGRLRSLKTVLDDARSSAASLLDVLDDTAGAQLSRALTGRVIIERRSLKDLVIQLRGRRLTPQQVRQVVEQWVSDTTDNTVIAVTEDDAGSGSGPSSMAWWPAMHHKLFMDEPPAGSANLEAGLEQLYPAAGLQDNLARIDDHRLVDFVVSEPFHTGAVRAGWLLLAERIVTGSPWPQAAVVDSRHVNPDSAAGIRQRLAALKRICALRDAVFPDTLRVRLPLSAILTDPWASPQLRSIVHQKIQKTSLSGEQWLATLPAVGPINLTHNPLVIILDGVSPDVWLETLDEIFIKLEDMTASWQRLETRPATAVSIASLFGFTGDPFDNFHARGIEYHQVKGNEAYGLADLLPEFVPDKPAVIRVALVDEAAHAALLRLVEMPAAICGFLEKELPRLRDICATQKRRLIITTDHGLSLTGGGLSHGKGGVYEKAIFRAQWRLEPRTG
jgi:hypothetical protein